MSVELTVWCDSCKKKLASSPFRHLKDPQWKIQRLLEQARRDGAVCNHYGHYCGRCYQLTHPDHQFEKKV